MTHYITSADLRVGMEVGIQSSARGGCSAGWIVERITPGGQITVKKGDEVRRFTRNLEEVGIKRGRFYGPPRIVPADLARREEIVRETLRALAVPAGLEYLPRIEAAAARVASIREWADRAEAALRRYAEIDPSVIAPAALADEAGHPAIGV